MHRRARRGRVKGSIWFCFLGKVWKRCNPIVRIFPNKASCLRLVRASAGETHEDWIETIHYLNRALHFEHKKAQLRQQDNAA